MGSELTPAKYISQPYVFGPGSWAFIHIVTLKATTTEAQYATYRIVVVFMENLPCMDCRKNAAIELSKFPLMNYIGSPRGLFNLFADMHDSVNVRLGKLAIGREKAYEIWSPSSFCESDCGEHATGQPVRTNSPPTNWPGAVGAQPRRVASPPAQNWPASTYIVTPNGQPSYQVRVHSMSPPRRPGSLLPIQGREGWN